MNRRLPGGILTMGWCDFFRFSAPYGKVKDSFAGTLEAQSYKLLARAYRHHKKSK